MMGGGIMADGFSLPCLIPFGKMILIIPPHARNRRQCLRRLFLTAQPLPRVFFDAALDRAALVALCSPCLLWPGFLAYHTGRQVSGPCSILPCKPSRSKCGNSAGWFFEKLPRWNDASTCPRGCVVPPMADPCKIQCIAMTLIAFLGGFVACLPSWLLSPAREVTLQYDKAIKPTPTKTGGRRLIHPVRVCR